MRNASLVEINIFFMFSVLFEQRTIFARYLFKRDKSRRLCLPSFAFTVGYLASEEKPNAKFKKKLKTLLTCVKESLASSENTVSSKRTQKKK